MKFLRKLWTFHSGGSVKNASVRLLTAMLIFFLLGLALIYIFLGPGLQNERMKPYQYLIGLSLSDINEPWQQELIESLQAELAAYPEVNLIVRDAAGSLPRQKENLRELGSYGIDLLALMPSAPTELDAELANMDVELPLIRLGVPRGDWTNRPGQKTAWLGYDNAYLGRVCASYITARWPEEKSVLVLRAEDGNLIDKMRFESFKAALPADWNMEEIICRGERGEAENRIMDYLVQGGRARLVLAGNDEKALGAEIGAEKLREKGFSFVGIDGFGGEEQGQALLREGKLQATVLCQDMGKALLELALRMIKGEAFDPNNGLPFEILPPLLK